MTYDPEACIDEILRQVTASSKALTERLARGGDIYGTLVDTVRILGNATDILGIGLALQPGHPVMDRLMRAMTAELGDSLAAIRHMDRQRAAVQAAAERAKAPNIVHPEAVTIH